MLAELVLVGFIAGLSTRSGERSPAGRTCAGFGVSPRSLSPLRRAPARVALGAGGLAVGVAALTVLLAIQRAFQGVLVDTLLGRAISIQVHGTDYAAAG